MNQLGEPERSKCYSMFANRIHALQEAYIPSREIVSSDWPFLQYGLTDCGIAILSRNQYLVLTDDLKAANYLNSQGVETLNFNNLRSY